MLFALRMPRKVCSYSCGGERLQEVNVGALKLHVLCVLNLYCTRASFLMPTHLRISTLPGCVDVMEAGPDLDSDAPPQHEEVILVPPNQRQRVGNLGLKRKAAISRCVQIRKAASEPGQRMNREERQDRLQAAGRQTRATTSD